LLEHANGSEDLPRENQWLIDFFNTFSKFFKGTGGIIVSVVVLGLGIGAIVFAARGKATKQRFTKQAIQYGITAIMMAVMAFLIGGLYSTLFSIL
jgi:hypothetical protein